jgi:hypothetical protein
MSNPIKEEFQRFQRLLINYSKVIVGGMTLSSMFLFFYAGIRANYVSIAVLATVVSTISLSLFILLLYVRFHEKRSKTRLENIPAPSTKRDSAENEELTRIIAQAIADLPSAQTKKLSKQNLFVVEHVLLSVFQWGRLIGKMFYYGLAMVKVESGFSKGPKQV